MSFTIHTALPAWGPLGALPGGEIKVRMSDLLALTSQHADHRVSA